MRGLSRQSWSPAPPQACMTHAQPHTLNNNFKQTDRSPFSPHSPLGEDDILIDPSELLGRRLDFQLVLEQCCGLRWIREEHSRGVQIG